MNHPIDPKNAKLHTLTNRVDTLPTSVDALTEKVEVLNQKFDSNPKHFSDKGALVGQRFPDRLNLLRFRAVLN